MQKVMKKHMAMILIRKLITELQFLDKRIFIKNCNSGTEKSYDILFEVAYPPNVESFTTGKFVTYCRIPQLQKDI
jgi:hypothetical protein